MLNIRSTMTCLLAVACLISCRLAKVYSYNNNVYLHWSLLTLLSHLLQQSATSAAAAASDNDDVIVNRPNIAETDRTFPTSVTVEREQMRE